jgi:hypothetical protein
MKESFQKAEELFPGLIKSIICVLFMYGFREMIPTPTFWDYFYLLLLIIILYFVIYPYLKNKIDLIKVQYRRCFPKIGVLNGSIISPLREYKCERGWTNVTPSMWFLALRGKLNKRIKFLSTSQINNSYTIIINPFGDIFPEQDTKLHKTFYSICEFINNGGFFVVTGGAFFSHQNTINSSQHEWVFEKITNGQQSLKDSLLFREFGIQTTGNKPFNEIPIKEPVEVEVYQKTDDIIYTGKIDIPSQIKRFRATKSESSNYIPFIREKDDKSYPKEKDDKSYPVVAVRYGKGYLIHAGMFLESETSKEFELFLTIIINLIKSKFKNL